MVIPASSRFGFRSEVENKEYQATCYSMANEIDELIGNNEVPEHAKEFAMIVHDYIRQLPCDDGMTKAAVMVLMVSTKVACKLGWFPQKETQELMATIDLMWSDFTDAEYVTPCVTNPLSLSLFEEVKDRFYPFVKIWHIIDSFEAQQKSKALLKDFYISKNMRHRPTSRVHLFVVQTEDISKSICIVHPQEVSILLNGRNVENRVNISMDSGPQLPTDVTRLVNLGANILQAIGSFGGSYLVVIAITEAILLPEKPLLKDYVHSEAIESNSDYDIIEGPSRISLSCPISRTRIKLPVKGHVCKHLQCFDFWNYVGINNRRPSWRCPHCNQSVCYTDIRVDQNMIKILEEVGCNTADVVISVDGSWSVVTANNENVDHVRETTHDHGDPKSLPTSGPTVMDLTGDEDEMDTSSGTQVGEQNPCFSEIPYQSNNTHTTATDHYSMLNQSSASVNALSEWPQTLNAFSGQQFMNRPQIVNTRDAVARQTVPMPFLPSSSPQDRLSTNTASFRTPVPPAAQYSQFQGSHVTSLRQCQGRTSDSMERWNYYRSIDGNGTNQTQVPGMLPLQHHYEMQNQNIPVRSVSPAQQRPMLSSVTHPQTLPVNYGRTTDQRHMQMLNPGGVMEFMNLAPANTANRQPQTRPQNHMANTANRQPQTRPQNHMANTANRQPQTRPQNHMANTANRQPQTRPQNQMPNTANRQPQTLPQNQMPNTANRQPQTLPQNQMPNSANRQPLNRMRGSITPGSTAYDQRIILPTRPVYAQAETLPPPHTTTYNLADEVHPTYPNSNNDTLPGNGSLPAGLYYSMPHETR